MPADLQAILPITEPVVARWHFICPPTKHKAFHTYDFIYKETRPDTDGFLKVPKDCIQNKKLFKKTKLTHFWGAGVIEDDSLIVNESIVKAYVKHGTPGISVLLKPAGREFKAPEYIKRLFSQDSSFV